MNTQILTIAIPTYNGADVLEDTIKNLLMLRANTDFFFEILISNNCSTDLTEEICNKYLNQISYFKNTTNMGYDLNCNNCIEKASSDFVWLIADDDRIIYPNLNPLKDLLINHKDTAAFFINYPNEIKLNFLKQENGFDIKIFNNGNDFFQDTKFKNGLISSNIFNKNLWLSLNIKNYPLTGWIHFQYLVRAFECSGYKGIVVKDFGIFQVEGRQKWGFNGEFILIGFELVKILQTMNSSVYNIKTREMAISIIRGSYPINLIKAKAQGLNVDIKFLLNFLTLFKKYPSTYFVYLPILIIPTFLYTTLYKILKFISILPNKDNA